MVKRELAADVAASRTGADDCDAEKEAAGGSRLTTIHRNPALTVYLTAAAATSPSFFSLSLSFWRETLADSAVDTVDSAVAATDRAVVLAVSLRSARAALAAAAADSQ